MTLLETSSDMALILASHSPRRKELLEELGLSFEVIPSGVVEESSEQDPEKRVLDFALQKAAAVAPQCPTSVVIGADTVVACDGEIFEKPTDDADAKRMLNALSGGVHQVIGGVAIVKGTDVLAHYAVATEVTFRKLSQEMITAYLNTREHEDKAGAYGIQGKAQVFVREISGSYPNVVGLDVVQLSEELVRLGVVKWRR